MVRIGEIIRVRWREVVLIVGLQVGMAVLVNEVMKPFANGMEPGAEAALGTGFLMGLGLVVLAIVWQLLFLGFIATACHEGAKIQEPGQLVSVGKYFFWRFVRFEIAFGIVSALLVSVVMTFFVVMRGGVESMAEMPDWAMLGFVFIVMAILAKVKLLLPAEMIAGDRGVRDGFKAIGRYPIGMVKGLCGAFVCFIGLSFAFSYLVDLMRENTVLHYILMGGHSVVSSFVMLVITLYAIRFVLSHGYEDVGTEDVAEGESEGVEDVSSE